jgi:LmbE family N-acetylglucosaminyl deacetylase
MKDEKILIIAPHPNDEVLGCGATIAKLSQNTEVHLCIITSAYTPDWTEEFLKEREKEIDEASRILGIKERHFLNLPTVKLDKVG